MISLRLKVRFAGGEDYGRSLGRLRSLLKTQAKLAGLEIRMRADGAEIVGPIRRVGVAAVERPRLRCRQSM